MKPLLAPPAATSPSLLQKRRPKLLTKKRLEGLRPRYDVVVIGSGLAGLTAANVLAKSGRSVLLLEQHYNFGGMATWFKRQNGHIFDISLHGFPVGMKKTCRKYWTQEIADSIVQLKSIRFDNPQFSARDHVHAGGLHADPHRGLRRRPRRRVEAFFEALRGMNFFDDDADDHAGALRALLPRPQRRPSPADGADRLRQRLRRSTIRRSPTASSSPTS